MGAGITENLIDSGSYPPLLKKARAQIKAESSIKQTTAKTKEQAKIRKSWTTADSDSN